MWRRNRDRMTAEQATALYPLRAPRVTEEAAGDGLTLRVARSPGRAARWLSRFFTLPPTRTFALDRTGADVWRRCDGATSVRAIAAAVAADHGWPAERAEKAVLVFLSTLSERRLVGFSRDAVPAGGAPTPPPEPGPAASGVE